MSIDLSFEAVSQDSVLTLVSFLLLVDNNATLEIRTALYTTDTGAYKCKAKNKAGTDQDIGTVFIENNKVPKYSKGILISNIVNYSKTCPCDNLF